MSSRTVCDHNMAIGPEWPPCPYCEEEGRLALEEEAARRLSDPAEIPLPYSYAVARARRADADEIERLRAVEVELRNKLDQVMALYRVALAGRVREVRAASKAEARVARLLGLVRAALANKHAVTAEWWASTAREELYEEGGER